MSFDIFGFEFIRSDGIFGFWIGSLKVWKTELHKSLLCVHRDNGDWRFEVAYVRLV